ncbi:MAG: hypothetical protein R6W69_03250 [Anaerolineales bacterium]
MRYPVHLEDFDGQNIEVDVNFWSGSKLLVNGEPAPKGEKRGEFALQRNDGKQAVATWKPQALGFDVPQLVIDGKPVSLVEPLKWYQWVWGGIPVLLVFVGGFLGAIFGILAFMLNAKVFRADVSAIMKYVITAVISFVAVFAYFVIAVIVQLALGG